MSATEGEGLTLTETDVRNWIGQEIDKRFEGVAKKDDIVSAIADAFSKRPANENSSSASFDKDSLLSEIGKMVDEKLSKNSRRNPGFLTKILTG